MLNTLCISMPLLGNRVTDQEEGRGAPPRAQRASLLYDRCGEAYWHRLCTIQGFPNVWHYRACLAQQRCSPLMHCTQYGIL